MLPMYPTHALGLDFDVIIDGANVGFFKKQVQLQGGTALADLEQIDRVVQHYQQRGKRALVSQMGTAGNQSEFKKHHTSCAGHE